MLIRLLQQDMAIHINKVNGACNTEHKHDLQPIFSQKKQDGIHQSPDLHDILIVGFPYEDNNIALGEKIRHLLR
jgi:hypothetical protein